MSLNTGKTFKHIYEKSPLIEYLLQPTSINATFAQLDYNICTVWRVVELCSLLVCRGIQL